MESIPEWKRGALVVSQTEEQQAEELKSIFGRAKDRLKNRINETEAVQKFKQSEDYEKIEKLRAEFQEFKGELKEQVENS